MNVPAKTVKQKRNITSRLNAHLKHYPKPIRYPVYRKKCLWKFHRLYPDDPTINNNYRNACDECRCLIEEHEAAVRMQSLMLITWVNFTGLLTKCGRVDRESALCLIEATRPLPMMKAKPPYLMSSLLQHVYKTMAGHYKPKNRSQTASKSIQSTFRLKLYLKL